MSVVARRIASVPRRTSVETWTRIVELVSDPDSESRTELEDVTSVAATLIAEEHTKSDPITIAGGGEALVRVYTLHGDDAIAADFSDEDELAFNPTARETWLLSLPAAGADVAAAETLLAGASHVVVRDIEQIERSAATSSKTASGELILDLEELIRP
jgi:hypothetical protein